MTNLHAKPMIYKLAKQTCIGAESANIFGTNCRFSNNCESVLNNMLKNQEILPPCQFKNKIVDLLLKMKNMKGKLLVLGLLILAFNYLFACKNTPSFKSQIGTNKEIIDEEASVISPLVIVDKYMLQ